MTIKERWLKIKQWWSVDHVIDLIVDMALLLFDVISCPILIAVRIIRYFIGEWIVDGIKNIIKGVVHWFQRKRAYRLEHGHGIFRTYWWLIMLSPFIIFGLWMIIAVSYGFVSGIDEVIAALD